MKSQKQGLFLTGSTGSTGLDLFSQVLNPKLLKFSSAHSACPEPVEGRTPSLDKLGILSKQSASKDGELNRDSSAKGKKPDHLIACPGRFQVAAVKRNSGCLLFAPDLIMKSGD
jgi:hypothetical protein